MFDKKSYMKEYNKEYNKKNKERLKEKKRIYRESHKEYIKNRQAIYRENHKDELKIKKKHYAETHKEQISIRKKIRDSEKGYVHIHNKTGLYIRKYNLRPESCQICGNSKCIIEAHHPDYKKWNEVVFCCQHCHHEIHNGYLSCPQPIDLLININ